MPVYNGQKYLAEAIESILTQTFADFEFVIVDDGSQDGSAAIIQDYAGRDGRIHFIQLKRNCGQASALNRGIAEARGEYIALMDCDDISLPERLEKQASFLAANSDIGVVGVWIQVVNQDLEPRKTWDYPLRHVDIVLDLCLRYGVMGGATVMMRRDAVISVGGYDPQRLTNDKDLFTRLVGVTRFASLPQRLYWCRRHGRNMTVISHKRLRANGQIFMRAGWTACAVEMRRRSLSGLRAWGRGREIWLGGTTNAAPRPGPADRSFVRRQWHQ